MPDKVHDGTPLGLVDTAWLHMEDPTNLMMVTGMFLLDGPLGVDELRETLRERMVERFPRLSHRVQQQGSSAHWVEDPTFDLAAHVHRMGLPAPGGPGALRDVVSDLMSTPLDFTKPLWQCHLIEGVGRGSAVLMRLHHCIGDGLALVHVLLSMTDRVPWVEPCHPLKALRRSLERHIGDQVGWLADRAAGVVEGAVRATLRVGHAVHDVGDAIRHPWHLVELTQSAAQGATVLFDMLMRPADPPTPLRGPLGVSKRAAWSRSFPVAEAKRIGEGLGATINDVLLAAVSGGLRRYLERRGTPTRGLQFHAMVPVNLRPPERADDLGNRFGLIYLALPVGVRRREERLRLVQERMQAMKRSPEPVAGLQILGALGLAPRKLAEVFVNLFGSKATAVMTNVIGPREPIYFDGRRISDVMFWVPQSGRMGLGVSIFSYDGRVVVGVASDRGLVPDPESITEAFETEYRAMRASLARRSRRPRPARPQRPTGRPAARSGARLAAR
jgi:WS/DGAT/MGAT family acyltransferase